MNRIALHLFRLVIGFLILSCQNDKVKTIGILNGDKVILRSAPERKDETSTDLRLMKGDKVAVIKKSTNVSTEKVRNQRVTDFWFLVETEEGSQGWVFAPFLDIIKENSESEEDSNPIVEEIYIPTPPVLERPYIERERQNILTNIKRKLKDETIRVFGEEDKYLLLRVTEACDYLNDAVLRKSRMVVEDHEGNFNLGQVCDIYDYCLDGWSYVNDPSSREVFLKASTTVTNRDGDCDDFAILVGTMIMSIGGDVLINCGIGDLGWHAFSEVRLGEGEHLKNRVEEYLSARYRVNTTPGIRKDKNGVLWLNLDWFGTPQRPGGEPYECSFTYYMDIQRDKVFTN